MLQALYFPELQAEVEAVAKAEIALLDLVREQRMARMKNEAEWIKNWNPKPYYAAFGVYLEEIRKATEKCRRMLNLPRPKGLAPEPS
jgi:hypothetical protein